MTVRLNHTIVWCRDKKTSARFLTEILGRRAPARFGPFLVVEVDNGVSLDFHDTDEEIGVAEDAQYRRRGCYRRRFAPGSISARSAFASTRSGVPKPSVNHP